MSFTIHQLSISTHFSAGMQPCLCCDVPSANGIGCALLNKAYNLEVITLQLSK